MRRLIAAAFFFFGLTPAWAKPADLGFSPSAVSTMHALEERWGFVRSSPDDAWWGGGFRDGAGACGGPKELQIVVREEPAQDGSLVWQLRLHPDQPQGVSVTSVDVASGEVTTELFEDIDVFKRVGDRLTITQGAVVLEFERCD